MKSRGSINPVFVNFLRNSKVADFVLGFWFLGHVLSTVVLRTLALAFFVHLATIGASFLLTLNNESS